ncbi:M16 family metallopeptidase [Marinicaulis aureus]|uniref:M16 family metallopeptidase n=1 Tax=Hyphococcus aureus TaxID=2666033 RepID=A0ABW1KW73_9PROT
MRLLLSFLLLALVLAPSFAHAIDLEKTRVTHLDNGLTLLILEEHALPVVSVQMAYKTGGRDDPEGRMGLAHFFEHMAFRSSKNFPGTRLAGDIYAVGGEWHGYTWIDTVTFFATAPKDDLDLLLRIEADRLGQLKMDPNDVEAETGAVIAEMNGYANDPSTILFDATLAAAFQVHPYRKNTIGYAADVEAITHDDIVEFYENNIGPKTAVLTIAGDVDADAVEARVKKLFGKFRANAEPQLPPLSEPDYQGEKRIRLEGDVDQKLFRIAYPAPAASSEDYPAFLVLQALAGASSGVSFLQNDWGTPVSEDAALSGVTDDLKTWFIPTAQPYVFLIAGSAGANADEAKTENAVQRALDGLAAKPVSDSKLNRAKAQVQSELIFDIETTEDAAHQLAFFEAVGALDQLLTLEESIDAVTQADIQRVAKTYLDPDRRTIGWFVPDTDGAPDAIASPDTLTIAAEHRGKPAADKQADNRDSETQGAIIVAPSPLSPIVSLRALLPGVYDCRLCAANDPAPGVTSIAVSGLSEELTSLATKASDAIAEAKPAARRAPDSGDPYTRLEQIFTARFTQSDTPAKAAPAFIAVSGDVDAEAAKQIVETAFSPILAEPSVATITPSQGDIHVHLPEDKAQVALGYMTAAPALDSGEAAAWRLALYMFAHGYGGRLGEEAISNQGLAYYIGADYRGGKGAGLITLNIGVDPDKQQALLETLKAELARFQSEPPDEAELAEAKRHLIGRKISAAQSNEEITAALAQDWAGQGLTTIEDFSAAVNAVTLDELRDVLPAFADGDVVAISAGGEKQDRMPPETSPKRE